MKLDEKIMRREQLLRETRELLINVQQQYHIPALSITPKPPQVVRDLMRKEVHTVNPDIGLKEASELLLSKKITHLFVLKGRELVGVVTRTDILRGLVEGRKTVREVMTEKAMTVNPDDSTQSVARKASDYNISVFPVVDANGDLVGTISTKDL